MKYAVIIWIALTLFVNYMIAYNSEYHSDAPETKFMNKLPLSAIVCGVIVFGVYGLVVATSKQKKDK